MKTTKLTGKNIEELSTKLEDMKKDYDIVSVSYHFNTIEYYWNQEPYCEAFVDYEYKDDGVHVDYEINELDI